MNNDELSILRKIEKEKQINQRKIASELGISLGKVNYCLKELKRKKQTWWSFFTFLKE